MLKKNRQRVVRKAAFDLSPKERDLTSQRAIFVDDLRNKIVAAKIENKYRAIRSFAEKRKRLPSLATQNKFMRMGFKPSIFDVANSRSREFSAKRILALAHGVINDFPIEVKTKADLKNWRAKYYLFFRPDVLPDFLKLVKFYMDISKQRLKYADPPDDTQEWLNKLKELHRYTLSHFK